MKFAENNRISHRQLYRQIVLGFLAPFLLCLFGRNQEMGLSGILGTAAALLLLPFYIIFLFRIAPYYGEQKKMGGKWTVRLTGLFFLSYVLLTGGYLLALLGEIVPKSLVTGVSGRWIAFFALVVCMAGSHRGMQRRGRIAEVSAMWILGGVLLLMIIGAGQGKLSYLEEMPGIGVLTGEKLLKSSYGVLCAFSGIGLLPFGLEHVEKQASAGKTVIWGVLTLGGIVLGMHLLLPWVFGWNRLGLEAYPVLPLLSQANLPGNILARFDVIWMAVLVYGFLFSIGSLLHYGSQILSKSRLGEGHYWLGAGVYLIYGAQWGNTGIREYYPVYLGAVFVPGMILIQLLYWNSGKHKRKKRGAVAALFLLLTLGLAGCGGIEPEKRNYPLSLGFDVAGETLAITYEMPDLPQETGQDKAQEEQAETLTITGQTFGEIRKAYERSQEKYLDLGHVQILILGKQAAEGEGWRAFLSYLEQESFVGENMYVFVGENVEEILKWKSSQGTCAGEYLTGILENRMSDQVLKEVTLREVIHEKDQKGTLLQLPRILLKEGELQLL